MIGTYKSTLFTVNFTQNNAQTAIEQNNLKQLNICMDYMYNTTRRTVTWLTMSFDEDNWPMCNS